MRALPLSGLDGSQHILAKRALREGELAVTPVDQNDIGRNIDVAQAEKLKLRVVDCLGVGNSDAGDQRVVVGDKVINLESLIRLKDNKRMDMMLFKQLIQFCADSGALRGENHAGTLQLLNGDLVQLGQGITSVNDETVFDPEEWNDLKLTTPIINIIADCKITLVIFEVLRLPVVRQLFYMTEMWLSEPPENRKWFCSLSNSDTMLEACSRKNFPWSVRTRELLFR